MTTVPNTVKKLMENEKTICTRLNVAPGEYPAVAPELVHLRAEVDAVGGPVLVQLVDGQRAQRRVRDLILQTLERRGLALVADLLDARFLEGDLKV